MKVRTSAFINKPPDEVWPLLCGSKMDDQIPLQFRLGIPKPVECRLKGGTGGVGGERQCVSDRGVINQRITEWVQNRRLKFEMKDTDMYFGKCVTSIKENFDLAEHGARGTMITRTTEFKVKGWFGLCKSALIWIGLKNVHLYVFKNWAK